VAVVARLTGCFRNTHTELIMEIEPFRQMSLLSDIASGAKPSGVVQPRMYRQAMIKDKDNNIYAVYGDRLKKGKLTDGDPWQAMDLQQDGSGYSFRVYPGTINNILPSNTFASDGGFVKFTIQADTMTYLFLDVATDGKKINTAELKIATNLPTDAPPVATNIAPSKIVVPLGIIKNSAAVKLRSSAITATPVVAGTISKVPQNPNDEPFTRTWMWKVESK